MKKVTQFIIRSFFSFVLFFSMNIQATANHVYLTSLTVEQALDDDEITIFTNTATEQESENEVISLNEVLEQMLATQSLHIPFQFSDGLNQHHLHYQFASSLANRGLTTPPPELS